MPVTDHHLDWHTGPWFQEWGATGSSGEPGVGYLGIAVVEVGGQEAVGEVAFDEAGRCQFLRQAERGGGQRRTPRLPDWPGPVGPRMSQDQHPHPEPSP